MSREKRMPDLNGPGRFSCVAKRPHSLFRGKATAGFSNPLSKCQMHKKTNPKGLVFLWQACNILIHYSLLLITFPKSPAGFSEE